MPKFKVRAKEIAYLEEMEIEAETMKNAIEQYEELWENGMVMDQSGSIVDFVVNNEAV